MNNREKAKVISRILNKTYPKISIPLNYKNTFTLLVSVLLSAQCTDVNVNNVTKGIYPKYNKPKHFVKLGRKKIERLIKRIGIFIHPIMPDTSNKILNMLNLDGIDISFLSIKKHKLENVKINTLSQLFPRID